MTRLNKTLLALGFMATLVASSSAEAQSYLTREGNMQVGGGIGFAASIFEEEAFAFGGDFNYYFTQNISIAPRLGFAVDDDFALIQLMVDGLWHFDIPSLRELVPFGGIGMGVSILKVDGVDAEAAFAFELPFGVEYFLKPQLSLGTEMYLIFPVNDYFNGPFGTGGDHFHFQWLLGTVRYLF